ncbi:MULTISPECIES: hypothetical protein [unclassified Caballeronia]|uniref:hypothetical protein n=1 Tax=unclassified Caballeronia TaxID=2646786 RepID=UPI0028672EB1|nr:MULTISPECIES: hypothetical protein [unclassified Caballeronia]MDR5776530.1 hypothetical protein [Caballeronia sp. LZ002]MDR5803460.1 hypothetical protein [Caballeronia sp. LZ001]MDR5851965.1 hypothetical protein [Caballeronia sp. LZ003]
MKALSLKWTGVLGAIACTATVAMAAGGQLAAASSQDENPVTQNHPAECVGNDNCKKVESDCRACCSETHLPTCDHGFGFFNCVNKCKAQHGCLGKREHDKKS